MKAVEGKSEFIRNELERIVATPLAKTNNLTDKEKAFIKTLNPKAFVSGSVQRQMCELLISIAERDAK